MSVSPMKAVSIIGLMPDLNKVIHACGASQVFHPDEVNRFYSDTRIFRSLIQPNPYTEPLNELNNTLTTAQIEPDLIDADGFKADDTQIESFVSFFTERVDSLIAKIESTKKKMNDSKIAIKQASHFVGSQLQIDRIMECKYIKPTFGRLPKDSLEKLDHHTKNPYAIFFPCTQEDDYYWGVYVSPVSDSAEVDRIFSSLYFERIDIAGMHSSPEEYLQTLQSNLSKYEQELSQAQKEVEAFIQEHHKECMLHYTKLTELYTYFNIKNNVMTFSKSFILVGWIPAEHAESFTKSLEKIKSVELTLSDGTKELQHSPPIKLKNNFLSRPYEYYLKMFGLPKYNEIDPTGFIAVTYTLLFGIMFGDVGHGIVLALAGLLMWFGKKMELGKVLIPCGISSTVFGVIFGSVFGFEHALDGFYQSAFGLPGKPIDVMAPDTINTIIFSAVGIGVFLLIVAMGLNIYTSLRQREYESALFSQSGAAGLIFYTALVIGLVCQMFLNIPIMTAPYIIGLIIIPVLLIFLKEPLGRLVSGRKDWQPEKWGEYCMQSAFEMIEIMLSYATNTMSFLRVGVFILVHAGMMLVVFTLAEMSTGIAYIAILIIGNIVVIALEGLVVSIQVLRLEFYELFNRFYSGSGRPYEPVLVKKIESK